jgi:hypothetical protein
VTALRCNDLVERNGYWTGRHCRNAATCLFDGVPVCGIHKNKRLRWNRWSDPCVEARVRPLPESETP